MDPTVERSPQEAKIFPVSAEAVNTTLVEIAANPRATLLEEASLVAIEDPALDQLIGILDKIPPVDTQAFLEGALWTRRILKTQAGLSGVKIPTLTRDAGMSYLRSQLERVAGTGIKQDDLIREDMDELRTQEPELLRARDEITKYRAETTSFDYGVLTTSRALKRVEEGQALASNLHL